jgi:hypothetical protein
MVQVVTSVPRHDYPTDNAAEGLSVLNETANWILGELDEPDDIGRGQALSTSLALAQTHCAVDPYASKFETWEAWVTAMQVGSALFDSATAAEGPVVCRIGSHGEVKNLPATGPTSYTHAGAWLTSFYLAVVCRDNARLERLAQVPVAFLRESGAVFDEYIYSWVETLQSLFFGRQDVGEKLESAFHGTDPEVAQVADKETLLKILYPPINLFYRFVKRDSMEFNEALVEALTWHKQYWTGDEARSLSSDGLVALGPLALACMAYDNDFPIEVESEYLPKALLQRNWVGEYAT